MLDGVNLPVGNDASWPPQRVIGQPKFIKFEPNTACFINLTVNYIQGHRKLNVIHNMHAKRTKRK